MKKHICLWAVFLIASSTLICQTSSNSYPKTVTGAVDFGKDTFTLFTQEQKIKILDKLIKLDECKDAAAIDSAMIEHYGSMVSYNSVAVSDLREQHSLDSTAIEDYKALVHNRDKQIGEDSVFIMRQQKKLKRQVTIKKAATTFASIFGFSAGVLVGIETYKLLK